MNQPSLELVCARGLARSLELSCTASSPKQEQSISCTHRHPSDSRREASPYLTFSENPTVSVLLIQYSLSFRFSEYVLCEHCAVIKGKLMACYDIKTSNPTILQFVSDLENGLFRLLSSPTIFWTFVKS